MNIARTLAIALALSGPVSAHADVVTDWNQQVFTSGGPQIQRTFAMVHIAMFDAVNGIERRYIPYLRVPVPPRGASAEAAAAAAAHGVLVRLFPAQQAALDAKLASSLALIPDGPGETNGTAYGDLVAHAVYLARLGDRMLEPGPLHVDGTEAGDYQLTSPGPPQPVNTGAARWKPFGLKSAAQFRPNGPARLRSREYARDVEEVQLRGGSQGVRTPDENQIANWHTEQGQFQLNRIAQVEVAADGGSLLDHARVFALLNIAVADATTSVFEAKYHYNFWRPSTAIRNADIDGNQRTTADPTWSPFLTTPPHPEYPAAHTAVQAAGAQVLKDYFGRHHSFSTTAPAVAGVSRFYTDFDAYLAEGELARILGGMHFRHSLEDGGRAGTRVGKWVLDNMLQPRD